MKIFKKAAAVFLLICVLAQFFAVNAFAAGSAEKHTITFDVQGIGEAPEPVTVNDGECYLYLRENNPGYPTADGYVFHCWVTTLDFEQDEVAMSDTAAYLETPIHEDMTLYAVWYKLVDKVDITVDPPKAGDVIGTDWYRTDDFSMEFQSPRPHAEVTSEGACIKDSFWSSIGKSAFWLEDPSDRESTFKGTFEDGKEYGVLAEVEPIFGYEFADRLTITFNGKTLAKQNCDYNLCVVTAPIMCGEKAADSGKTSETEAAGKSTKDQTSVTKNSSNPYAVQTGDGRLCFMIFLPIAAAAVLIVLRSRKKAE